VWLIRKLASLARALLAPGCQHPLNTSLDETVGIAPHHHRLRIRQWAGHWGNSAEFGQVPGTFRVSPSGNSVTHSEDLGPPATIVAITYQHSRTAFSGSGPGAARGPRRPRGPLLSRRSSSSPDAAGVGRQARGIRRVRRRLEQGGSALAERAAHPHPAAAISASQLSSRRGYLAQPAALPQRIQMGDLLYFLSHGTLVR
jgi:hypothetical protein